jgi:CubicO group peptidase (beta-lactamase class C family)
MSLPLKMRSALLIAALLLSGHTLCELAQANDSSEMWPTKEWRTSTPEEQGMDSTTLANLIDFGATHELESLLVIRHGTIVAEAYYAPFRAGVKHRINSATKSIIGTLIAIALREGLLDSLDHRVMDFFSDRTIAHIEDNKKAITIQNLLDMTSGLDWTEPLHEGVPRSMIAMERSADWEQFVLDRPMATEPGAAFNYDSGNPQLLSAILTRLTGQSALDYARKRLFEPLGISDVFWRSDPDGVSIGGYGLFLQPRDMAKFGYLYLRKGIWDGHEIVPPSWIDRIRRAPVPMNLTNFRYANLFWVAPDSNAYLANGYHGQRIFVMPALDIVAVTTGTGHSASIGKEIEMIANAVKSDNPLPPDAEAQSLLAHRIQEAATEKSSPVGPVPEIEKTISGKIYRFPDNALRLSTLTLNLDGPNPSYAYELNNGRSDARVERFEGPIGLDGTPNPSHAYELQNGRPDAPVERVEGPIGLDGNFRVGVPTNQGTTVAKGTWSYGNFVLQFGELGGDNMRKVILSFEGNGVDLVFVAEVGPSVKIHGESAE